MKRLLLTAAIVGLPAVAEAHHEEIVRQAVVTLDLGWPILVAVGGAIVAYLRDAIRS